MSWRQGATVALALVLAAASFGLADKPAPPAPKAKEKQVVTTKAGKHVPATSVNFKKAYHLPFDNYKMQVPPGGSRWCVLEHKWNPTVLKAYGSADDAVWGPRQIFGAYTTYTWNLQ